MILCTSLLYFQFKVKPIISGESMDDICSLRQPNADSVNLLAEMHRNSITVLKKISECCIKEVDTWKSQATALAKARDQEQKAVEKAQEAERKAAEKLADKEEKKRAAVAAALAKKKAEEAAANGNAENGENGIPKPDTDDTRKTRKRRTGGKDQVDDSDPIVIQQMSKFQMGNMACLDDVRQFLQSVALRPGDACIARLKKAAVKKVMTDSRLLAWRCNCMMLLFFGGGGGGGCGYVMG